MILPTVVRDEIGCRLIRLVNQIEDPGELATVFSGLKPNNHLAETIGSQGMAVIALNLHQLQQPLVLNCWMTPEEEQLIDESNKTLFDLCFFKIDSMENLPMKFLSNDQTDQVLANLESVKKTSASDVQHKRIDRIIEKIRSQLEPDDELKISYNSYTIENVQELAGGSWVVTASLTRVANRYRTRNVTTMKTEARQTYR